MPNSAVPGELDIRSLTLPAWGTQAVVIQLLLLISASYVLPSVAHAMGIPVRTFLPMHWPVLLAGLVYGWRSGLLIGLSAPLASYALSGMPPLFMLPAMTVELGVYGLATGVAREVLKLGWFLSTLAALAVGRVIFLGYVFATGSVSQSFVPYVQAAMTPGLIAAVGQLIALPFIARRWVGTK